MRKINSLLLLTLFAVLLGGCSKDDYDVVPALAGKTFVYDNGYSGSDLIRITYKFENSGNVYHKSEVGTLSPFDTSGCDLYCKMEGNNFTIYHGAKGWKKEVRNTVYETGIYNGVNIIIDGKDYIEK